MKIVVIDPRRTATCEFADLHLPVRAGTDVWLFNGLLAYLHQHGVVDADVRLRITRRRERHCWSRENTAGDMRAVAKALRRRSRGAGRVLRAVRAHRARPSQRSRKG